MITINSNKLQTIILLFVAVFLLAGTVHAEKSYIVDVLVVSLREGPGSSFRVIKSLKTGASFDVLEKQNKFIKIKTDDGTEGWLPKQYTSTTPPKALVVKKFENKIAVLKKSNEKKAKIVKELKNKLAEKGDNFLELKNRLDEKTVSVQTELARLAKELERAKNQYEDIVTQSKDAIETRNERDSLKKELSKLGDKAERLEKENMSLANRQALYWFLSGAGVFLLGWLIGKTTFRRQKSSLSL